MKHPYWMAPTTVTDEEAWDNYFAFRRALVKRFMTLTINRYNDFGDISKEEFDSRRGPNGPQIPGMHFCVIHLTV